MTTLTMNTSSPQTVSLIIPVYNEREHLAQFLTIIDDLQLPLAKELVIVNDCSTDGSADILRSFAFKSRMMLIDQPVNRGKGAALRVGIENATGDIIGVQDADMETDTSDIGKLLLPLVEDRADVVYGSRFKKSHEQVHRTFHYLMNRLVTMISNLFSGLYLTDMETCYKFFRADVIKNIRLESNRFGFEPEVTAKIARLDIRIMELPISYYPRKYLEGKKLNWKDGVAAVKHIVHFNLLKKQSDCFHPTLPARYLTNGRNWL